MNAKPDQGIPENPEAAPAEPHTDPSLLNSIIDNINDPIFSIDVNYCYLSFNKSYAAAMKALYGVAIELGRSLFEYQAIEADRLVAKANLDRALRGEQFTDEASSGTDPNKLHYYEVSHNPIRNSGGHVIGVAVIVKDLTERRLTEQKHLAIDNRYHRLHNSMMDGFALTDLKGRFRECSQSYLDMLGYDMDELRQMTYDQITPAQWHDMENEIIAKDILIRGYSDIYEKEYRKKDGTIFPIEIRTVLLRNDLGEPEAMWAIVRDITLRKLAEQAMQESEAKHLLLLQHAGVTIAYLDPTGTIIFLNEMACRFLGGTLDLYVNRHVSDVFGKVMGDSIVSRICQAIQSGKSTSYEDERDLPTGHYWFQTIYSPVPNGDDTYGGVQLVIHDITFLKDAEARLQESNDALQNERAALLQKHAALRETLALLENERDQIKADIKSNVDMVISPLLTGLKGNSDKHRLKQIEILENAIATLTSPFIRKITQQFSQVSPREIEVCQLIKEGLSSKEIADCMGISLFTVHKFRQRIREKLGISNDKSTIVDYLRTIDTR